MNPFSLISVVLVMLGTDELRSDTTEDSARTMRDFLRSLKSSVSSACSFHIVLAHLLLISPDRSQPNLLYTAASVYLQKCNMLVGHTQLGSKLGEKTRSRHTNMKP